MNDQLFRQTIERFERFEEVDAIVLGGSRASGKYDSYSDYDLYIYLNNDLSVEKRKAALSPTCKYLGLSKAYWGAYWDDCIFNNVIPIEITYETINGTRQKLRKNIVSVCRELLDGMAASCFNRIEVAIKRNDVIGVNYRLSEFTKYYFDILFALNRTFHPGEKRLIEFGIELCEWLPVDFESDLHGLFTANENDKILSIISKLISNMDDLIEKHL